jgi:hypothetical protein
MTTIKAKIPDYLAKLTAEIAEKEKVSVDEIVAQALASQISAWKVRDDIEVRAKRGKVEDLDLILAKVPNAPPVSGDEL